MIIGVGAVLAVVAVLLISFVVTVRRPLPTYDGSIEVPGLRSKVTVLRDAQGVPQVYAANAQDLFYAQGYVQAQDRFFQMDLRRHIAAGRLSELVGRNPTALASDKVTRTLGWRRVAEQELPLLSGPTRNYLQSFSDGVNAYISSKSAVELSASYVVLGTHVDLRAMEAWTPVDSLSWLKAMAWDLKGNYNDELGRALAYGSVGNVALVNELYPSYPQGNPTILPSDPVPVAPVTGTAGASVAAAQRIGADEPATSDGAVVVPDQPEPSNQDVLASDGLQLQALEKALDSVGTVSGGAQLSDAVGSNSWVVSGRLTSTGRAMLANDPHLAQAIPSVWYQTGLHCTTVSDACPFDVSGFSFAGMPGIVIGHNAKIAWGLTNLEADTSDFFLERLVGNSSVVDGQEVPLTTRVEKIRVAGAADVSITVRSTAHGPIISDVIPGVSRAARVQPGPGGQPQRGHYAMSLAWTGLQPGRSMDSLFALDAATDWNSFRSALSTFDGPAQNVVYADTAGHIGYQAAGKIPTRAAGPGLGQTDGTWPRDGWDSSWNWSGYLAFDALPSELDPASGYIVAANQKVSPGSTLSQDWDYGYRAARITTMLTQRLNDGHKLTLADMTQIQLDTYDSFATDVLVPALLATPPSDVQAASQRAFTAQAVKLLRTWDGRQSADSAAAAYYNAVWSSLIRRTFDDQLPAEVQPDGGSRTFEVMRTLLQQPNSPWWDDISTPTITETRDQIVAEALVDARLELTAKLGKDPTRWKWGELHTLTPLQQPIGTSSPSAVAWLFNGDTLEVGGSGGTVNIASWDASSADYSVETIPSMRMVVDVGHFDSSTWVDFTGVSGHPVSPHYTDQLDNWQNGEPFAWSFGRKAVQAAQESELTLTPAPAAN